MKDHLLADFPHLDPAEWSLLSSNCHYLLINYLSNDQYALRTCQMNASQVQILKKRICYAIPNTPHLILQESSVNTSFLKVLVEHPPNELDKLCFTNICSSLLCEQINIVARTTEFLVKKFGFFTLTKKMVKINPHHSTVVWINEDFLVSEPQIPFSCSTANEGFKKVALNIIRLFEDAGWRKLVENLRKKVEAENIDSLAKFREFVDISMKCSNPLLKSVKKFAVPDFLVRRSSELSPSTLPIDSKIFSLSPERSCRKNQGSGINFNTFSKTSSYSDGLNEKVHNLRRRSSNNMEFFSIQKRLCKIPDVNARRKTSNSSKESSIQSQEKIIKCKLVSDPTLDSPTRPYPGSIIEDKNEDKHEEKYEEVFSPYYNNNMTERLHKNREFTDFEEEFEGFFANEHNEPNKREEGHCSAFHDLENELNSILNHKFE